MNLRPYQTLAVDAIYSAWDESQRTLITMPTGTGKTVVMAHGIKRLPRGRTMLVAHREELIWQAQKTIEKITGESPDVEMAEFKASHQTFMPAKVVVASIQTLNAGAGDGRVARFDPFDFGLLLIDEAHHAVAKTYRYVIDHFTKNPNLKVLGVTATPDRADESALGQIFESVAFDYEISDAIHDGWLVPIEVSTVVVDGLDLSSVRTTAGDLNGADLARVMEYEKNLHEVAHPTFEMAKDRRTLVFAASVAQAERLCEIFNRHRSECARWVSGETPKDERREIFRDYAAGRFQFLCNCAVATEGFDNPGVEVIAMARPTKSRALYAQMVGRGTRPLPGVVDGYDESEDRRERIALSTKPACEVIDFVGNAGKHKLVSAADILGGNFDDEVVERAAKAIREQKMGADALAALENAKHEIAEEKERAKREEAARRSRLRVNANYSAFKTDPFDILNIQPAKERGWDTGKQISDKMRGLLEKQGISADGMSYAHAKQLVGEICSRWEKKQCSFKMAKLLQRYMLPGDVSFDQAREWIDQISANNWKVPESIKQHVAVDVEVF